jgi:transposase-like protein
MKKRFSDEQIVRIVGESRVSGVPATAKRHAVSTHTVYLWRLKKVVADQSLALDIAKEALAKKS